MVVAGDVPLGFVKGRFVCLFIWEEEGDGGYSW